jgi:hypothetical protein
MKLLKWLFGSRKPALNKPVVIGSCSTEYKLGDELDLEMENNTVEKVTVVKITPHPEVKGSVYYEFSNGVVCRDIRLH